MKKIFVLLLALCVVFTFVSCVENVEIVTGDELGGNVGEITSADSTEAVTAEETTVKDPNAYKNNVLRPDLDPFVADKVLDKVMQNNNINRVDIKTITFLDTLKGKGADAWDVSDARNGSVWAWVENGCDLFIAGNGGVNARDCTYLFRNYANLTEINFNNCFYTDENVSLIETFAGCEKLETLDLSNWNTSNVEIMSRMFKGCASLTTVNLDGWDTSKSMNFDNLFDGCASLESVDVSHFDTSAARHMGYMFAGCESLTALDVSHFNTTGVYEFDGMFSGCTRLTTVGDLSAWNTERIVSMNSMFENCSSLTSIGNLKIPYMCSVKDMYKGTSLK